MRVQGERTREGRVRMSVVAGQQGEFKGPVRLTRYAPTEKAFHTLY